jgi:hypothetical protein
MPPSPWILRATARNRFGNQLARPPGGESPATALAAPPTPIYPLRSHAANRSPPPGPSDEPPPCLRSDDGLAGAERLFAPRHTTVGKTVRERSDRRRRRFATDAPATWLSTRWCTVARITSAAAVIASTRADEPFFRGDEPERSPSQTASLRQVRRYGHVEGALITND